MVKIRVSSRQARLSSCISSDLKAAYCSTYISAFIHDSNTISTAIPMYSGSSNTERLMGIPSDVCNVGIQRWRPITGNRNVEST